MIVHSGKRRMPLINIIIAFAKIKMTLVIFEYASPIVDAPPFVQRILSCFITAIEFNKA